MIVIRALLVVVALYATSFAQTASDGNDFYLGMLKPSFPSISPMGNRFAVTALISSIEDNTVSVSYFDPVTGIEEAPITYKVQARNSVSIPLNIQKMTASGSEVAEYRSVHIRGKRRISVQYFSTGPSAGGAYLGLPANVLGKKYVVASYNDNPDGLGALVGGEGPNTYEKSCGEFMIIGTENGTSVSILMRSASEGGVAAGETRTISLNRGQCYLVRSRCTSQDDDISGSIVESSHPIAVISGHTNAALGGVGEHAVEARDLMIEQMIPAEYWSSGDYVNVPFTNTDPSTSDGAGDTYRIYSFDTTDDIVQIGPTEYHVSRLHPAERINVEGKFSFTSKKGKPIMVCQYDQASHGDKPPYPRPSMIQLVPTTRQRIAYQFVVLQKTFEQAQEDYVYIFGTPNNILASKDGGEYTSLQAVGFQKTSSYLFGGTLYKVTPGTYVLKQSYHPYKQFIVYQYGFRSMSADAILGDEDGDDSYTSYAMPAGIALPYADTSNLIVTVDTLCNGWKICVTDARIEGEVRSATLADDPYGDIFPYDPRKRGPYQYYNTSFDARIDPNNTREVIFSDSQSVCFIVTIDNITKDSYAPVYITDKAGNGKMLELIRKRQVVTYDVPEVDYYATSLFGTIRIKEYIDSSVKIINHSLSAKPITVTSLKMKSGKQMQVVLLNRPITATLNPGDTLRFSVRFAPVDTGYYRDTLLIASACETREFAFSGQCGTGEVVVSDHDFGDVAVGSTSCTDTISVRNVGNLSFVLDTNWKLNGSKDFIFDPSRVRIGNRDYQLPVVIPAGGVVSLYVCVSPQSVGVLKADIQLETDISEPYTLSRKSSTHLKVTGVSLGLKNDVFTGQELRISPNPSVGSDVRAYFELSAPAFLSFNIYDIFGREVVSIPATYYRKGTQSVTLPVTKLAESAYILRVTDGSEAKSISFHILR
jgi:hypothetical protein